MAQVSVASTDRLSRCLSVPGVGEAVSVRNRRGVVVNVDPFVVPREEGVRLIQVVYGDGQRPAGEHILWGLEGEAVGGPGGISLADQPLDSRHMRALVGLRRWTVPAPFPGMETGESLQSTPVAPLYSGVNPLPHQIVPLEQALSQPVVRLLLADDVGLGKTIEAGLIINELLIRRRITRILVVAPPALREQWQQELWHRFALDFRIVDGPLSRSLEREMEDEISPWEVYARVITSPHYLRQPAVLETFLRACRTRTPAHLPWDLLVVDEAHHLAPGRGGDDSRLTTMLKAISPWFEHRVFLTATPHNGHHSCFTGLLEILDPVRFSKSAVPSPQEVARQREVVIRRTRRRLGRGNQPTSQVIPISLQFSPQESHVFDLFARLKQRLQRWAVGAGSQGHMGVNLCLEVLGKRLLSSWPAFTSSYRAFLAGIRADGGLAALPGTMPAAAGCEVSERAWHLVSTRLGRWLARHFPGQEWVFDELECALDDLPPGGSGADTRLETWLDWVDRLVKAGERAVVFTEYLVTLEFLARAVQQRRSLPHDSVAALHGGSSGPERSRAIASFVGDGPGVQLLLSTDILAEGLNLHRRARSLFHYDVPWSPVVLQQRLGRLDRLGQTRKVRAYHFRSQVLEELRLHRTVFAKTARIDQSVGTGNAVLAPIPPPSVPFRSLLLQSADAEDREQRPAVCARRTPKPSTLASMDLSRTCLLGTANGVMDLLEYALRACGLTVTMDGENGITLVPEGGMHRDQKGLLSLLAGPLGSSGFPAHLPRPFPGHPLLHWLLARLAPSLQQSTVPWLAQYAPGLKPGVLVFAIESAVTAGRSILHQGQLPIWLPFGGATGPWQLGPGELATTGHVERLLSLPFQAPSRKEDFPREQLSREVAMRLCELTTSRRKVLEEALNSHRAEVLASRARAARERLKELLSSVPVGPEGELERVQQQRRSGVLFPELAQELASREDALATEVKEAAKRRSQLLGTVAREATSTRREILAATELRAPLAIHCDGLLIVLPGGHHGI